MENLQLNVFSDDLNPDGREQPQEKSSQSKPESHQ